jgi:large subunit ribosomal protein L17
MCSLIQHQSINTTLAKAKEIRRYAEKVITIAKKGDLVSRRVVIARLNDQTVGSLLVDTIAPQIKRDSGYLKIERTGFRKGDHAEMATISFVDEISLNEVKESKPATAKKAAPKVAPKADKETSKENK